MSVYTLLYIILVICVTLSEIALYTYEDLIIFTPKDFKYDTDMNWFGCITCYIFLCIFSPIVFIFKMIYLIFHI